MRFSGSERDGTAIVAEAGHQRDVGGHRDFGGTVAFGIRGGRNGFAGEGERGRSGRGDRFMAEGHAQLARFGGDGGVDRSGELKDEVRRVVRGDRGGEVGGDVADEETARLLVQICGNGKKTGQKGIKGGERDQAASVFHKKFCGEIDIASLDSGATLVDGELPENVVVVQTPVQAVGFGADRAEGIEKFEESDVVAPLALHDREGIVGDGGVDGEMFFGSGGERDGEEQ